MLVAVWNLLTIILILVIIWLTRKEKITTQAGRYNLDCNNKVTT
ncbi:hypothetical protein ACGRWF_14405 (plasmid) [Lacticaseibacillus paracasei]